MHPLEQFLGQVRYIHGPGVAEESYYGAIEALFNAAGDALDPEVVCVMQLKDTGAGKPDGGLFIREQLPRAHAADAVLLRAAALPALPARGAIEVKSPAEDLSAIIVGEQVGRYLQHYRQVLVTNLREFVLMGLDEQQRPVQLESYSLADSDPDFWALCEHPRRAANDHGERLLDYLSRVCLLRAPLDSPQDVAWFLASYAREARARIHGAMAAGNLLELAALREELEETLGIQFRGGKGDHFFGATLVQTLFYGVFSAWVLWHSEHPRPDARFDWRTAAYDLHVPIIGAFFERLATPSVLRKLDLVEVLDWTGDLLNRVDRGAFFERFEQHRAVQYFYEPFLEAYDPELRKELGVWYTPSQVIEYMVARVDTVLREELDLPDGLADPRVRVLDPCCGTGAYLVAVLERIAETLRARGGDALLAHDLKRAAMERVFGFELLPAPFVIAHLQLGLLLQKMGVPLSEDERAAVYLTNALTGWEPAEKEKRQISAAPFRRERAAAERVKQDTPILVILGNPPYDSFADVALGEERTLSEAYREVKHGPKPRGQGLNDLYVRFYRMAERRIVGETGPGPACGIVCFISNYSWLDGLSHPGMRERYLEVFDKIWIDNLHGDRRMSEYAPDGRVSETVFARHGQSVGIRVGTAIALLARTGPHGKGAELLYRDFDEARAEDRRAALVKSLDACDSDDCFERVEPLAELGYPFKPRQTGAGYLDWPKLPDLFPVFFPGVQSGRGDLVVDIDRERLIRRMQQYFNPATSHEEMGRICPSAMRGTSRFSAARVREYLQNRGFLPDRIVRYGYRPFDIRWLYWEPETKLLDEKRAEYFQQVFEGNPWITSEQKSRRGYSSPQFARNLSSRHLMERGASFFPLYLKDMGLFGGMNPEPEPNLSDSASEYLAARRAQNPKVSAEHLFYHALAIMHSSAYRAENSGALRQDWPRVPLPDDTDQLLASAALGRSLAALLDPEQPVEGVTSGRIRPELREIAVLRHIEGRNKPLDPSAGDLAVTAGWGYLINEGTVTMPGQGKRVARDDGSFDVVLNDIACWEHLPAELWAYTLGGYPVLKKWLSYREKKVLGRDLRPDEARAFTEIARRIAAIIALHPELDGNYEAVKAKAYAWGGKQ